MHYASLAGAVWLYFEALFVHYAVTAGRVEGRLLKCYLPVAWTLPLAPLVLVAVLQQKAEGGFGIRKEFDAFGDDWRCWASYDGLAAQILALPFFAAAGVRTFTFTSFSFFRYTQVNYVLHY